MLEHFTRSEVSQLLGISLNQLGYWNRIGLVKPSLRIKGRVYYDFQDLICLKTAQGLIAKGLAATRIKKSIASLKRKFPELDAQLGDKRIYVLGNRAIISHRNRLIDSQSGQLFFKFDINRFSSEVSANVKSFEKARTAQDWFVEGLRFDSDPETYDRAIHAYKQAIKKQPDFAGAYVNMGTIYYKQKKFLDAQRCFRLAIQKEPYHAKACFNLGNVLDELNCTEEAVQWYERAAEADPTFTDVYFNLAAASERLGQQERALRFWKAYLSLDSESKHALVAKRRVKAIESQLVG